MATVDGGRSTATGGARSPLGIVFLVLFLDLVGFSIVFPLYAEMLTHYAATDAGVLKYFLDLTKQLHPEATPFQQAAFFGGLLGAFYSLLQFLTAPWWGRLSDRIGRRPVLLISLTGSVLGYAVWVVSQSFLLLILSRLITGVMSGNVAVANAAVADTTTPETRARSMAVVGMAFGLGFILGPAIGGLAFTYLPRLDHGWLLELGFNPFSTPALIALILAFGNWWWAWARFPETLAPERRTMAGNERSANPLRLFSSTLGRQVPTINLIFLLHTLLFAGVESMLVFLTAQSLNFTPATTGLMLGGMGFIAALMQGGVFRRLAPIHGSWPLVLAGFIALVPGFACLALVEWTGSHWLLHPGVVLMAVGTGLIFPGLSTMASLAGDPQRQGHVMGSFRSAGALGRALGPLLAALVYFSWRPAGPFVVGAIGVLLPAVLMFRLRALRVEARPEPAG